MVVKMDKRLALLLGLLLVLGLLPIAIHDNIRLLNILSAALIWGVVVSSWNLAIGYARVWTFGHVAMFGIGGYVLALTTAHLGISPWAATLLAGVVAAIFGILIGLLCLRLSGLYIALVTFGIALVLPILIVWARDITGGDPGMWGLAPLQLGPFIFSNRFPLFSYYIVLGISGLLLFIIYRIINSSIGLAFAALRDAEPFAKSLGVNELRYKLVVFGISSFIAGLMGAVFTSFYHGISPDVFGISPFLLALLMVMIGGFAKFPGAVIGAFVIMIASEYLRPLMHWRFVILGTMVVAVMVFMPQGLMIIPENLHQLVRRSERGRRRILGVLRRSVQKLRLKH